MDPRSSQASEAARTEGSDDLPTSAAVVVVGGGIAGLATAWQLTELGVRDVLLLEREPLLATHASGRNAAIFLPLEESLAAIWLSARSRDLLDARIGTSWLAAHGVALLSRDAHAVDELRYAARRLGVYHERWSSEEIEERLPLLEGGECREGIHLPLGGVMDVHLVLTRLRRWAAAGGARVVTAATVAGLETEQGRVSGIRLGDGRRIASERVVLASGAWGERLGQDAGSKLELTPLRRHLVQLVGRQHIPDWQTPVVWRVDEPIYFRPEAGGVLASPCDETPHAAGIPSTDAAALEQLAGRLSRLSPKLAEAARVQRSWACLRTMTVDREPAIGADRRVRGLYWCAGLGGRGMTCGVACGELLARVVLGLAHPLARTLSLDRLG